MKKIIAILLSMCIGLLPILGSAESEIHMDKLTEYEIVDARILGREHVLRIDAVKALAKVMGYTWATAYQSLYLTMRYTDNCDRYNYLEYVYEMPYMSCMYDGDIVLGDENHDLHPQRKATLREVAAFFTRALGYDETTLEGSMARALETGLITESDAFYTEDGKSLLTPEDLCVMLSRMLEKKRVRYVYVYSMFGEEVYSGDSFFGDIEEDPERSMTYAEYQSVIRDFMASDVYKEKMEFDITPDYEKRLKSGRILEF